MGERENGGEGGYRRVAEPTPPRAPETKPERETPTIVVVQHDSVHRVDTIEAPFASEFEEHGSDSALVFDRNAFEHEGLRYCVWGF